MRTYKFIESVEDWIQNCNSSLCCVNMSHYGRLETNSELKNLYYQDNVDLWLDGKILYMLYRLFENKKNIHFRGYDILNGLLKNISLSEIVFIGPDFQKDSLKEKIGNKNFISLPFVKNYTDFNYNSIINHLDKLNCTYVIVSLGAPKQEMFILELLKRTNEYRFVAIGAAVDYLINDDKIAPLFSFIYLEWFWRLINSPKKTYNRLKVEFLTLIKILIRG